MRRKSASRSISRIRGIFRQAYSAGTLSFTDAPAAGERDDTRRFSTDYLYSFGTQDALWNGAWGHVRVFKDGQSADLTTCMRKADVTPGTCSDMPVNGRLRIVAQAAATVQGTASGELGSDPRPTFPVTDLLTCKLNAPKSAPP